MNEIRFFVSSKPAPGGSKSAFPIYKKHGLDAACLKNSDWRPSSEKPCPTCGFTGRVAVSEAAGQANKDWRASVALAGGIAMKNADLLPLSCAIELELEFVMPRPKLHFKAKGLELKPGAPSLHTTRPDAGKLARSTTDALTSIIWRDDAQIVKETHSKAYGGNPGVWVIVKEAGPSPATEKPISDEQGRNQ